MKTTRLVREYLNYKEEDVMTTFQSRFGSQEWLQPYTDETLKKLPNEIEDAIEKLEDRIKKKKKRK